jgi:hypothetical protein
MLPSLSTIPLIDGYIGLDKDPGGTYKIPNIMSRLPQSRISFQVYLWSAMDEDIAYLSFIKRALVQHKYPGFQNQNIYF